MIPPLLRRFIPQSVPSTNLFQTLFLFGVRLYWGWQFFLTGKGKLSHLSRTSEFFASLNIPLPTLNAAMAGTIECLGGLLLLIGLGSRLASIPLILTMIVAYMTAHRSTVFEIWEKSENFVAAPPFLFLFAATLVFIFGPGQIALDAWFGGGSSRRPSKK